MICQTNKNLFIALILLLTHPCHAESAVSSELTENTAINSSSLEDFRARAQNPLAPYYSLPLKYTHHGGTGGVSIGSIQPIIPVSLGSWNMINQLSLNFIGTSGGVHGIAELPEPYFGSGASGLGDTNFTTLFSPVSSGNFSWGFGPTFVFPTDTLFSSIEDRRSRQLGSGKFSIGPSAMFVTQPKPWTLGLNIKQIWSVIGSASRNNVSQMVLQPFINYNLSDDGWYLVSDMDMIANWNSTHGEHWTVPVGGGVGKVFTVGKDAINIRAEGYYNPIRPSQAPEWSANLTFQYLFGKNE
jgi:hypothetical protein